MHVESAGFKSTLRDWHNHVCKNCYSSIQSENVRTVPKGSVVASSCIQCVFYYLIIWSSWNSSEPPSQPSVSLFQMLHQLQRCAYTCICNITTMCIIVIASAILVTAWLHEIRIQQLEWLAVWHSSAILSSHINSSVTHKTSGEWLGWLSEVFLDFLT